MARYKDLVLVLAGMLGGAALAVAFGVASRDTDGVLGDNRGGPSDSRPRPEALEPPQLKGSAGGGERTVSEAGTSASSRALSEQPRGIPELKRQLKRAFAAKDGRGVLRAIRELITLGKPGYEAAIPWILSVEEDRREGGKTLGLSHYEIARAVDDLGLYRYALTDTGVDERFRFYAALRLPWVGEPAVLDTILDVLPKEENVAVVNFLSDALRNLPGREERIAEVLFDAVEKVSDRRAQRRILDFFRTVNDPASERHLRQLTQSDDAELAAQARLALTYRSPPASGFLVTHLAPGSPASEAGIRLGDIITHANGRTFTSEASFGELLKLAAGRYLTLSVRRGEEERHRFEVEREAGELGIAGAYRAKR